MKQLILIVGICSLIITCKKKENPDKKISEFLFSKNALGYINIPVGKYFIYKDSATGSLDSVVVTESRLEKIYNPAIAGSGWSFGTPEHYSEKFTLKLSAYATGSARNWISGTAQAFASGFILVPSDTLSVNFYSDAKLIFNHPHSGNPAYTLSIEGKTYSDVNITNVTSGLDITHPMFYEATYYWAKGVGLIKRRIKQGSEPVKTILLVRNS
jgi:hypothetical protein